jgi:hypothetical protein
LRSGTVALKYASLVEFAKVWRISMGDYEIRILKTDGKPSLVYACSQAMQAPFAAPATSRASLVTGSKFGAG